MKAYELDPFCEMFIDLMAYLPQKTMTPQDAARLAEGYFAELGELTLEDVSILFRLAKRECEWFPTIAWLRNKAGFEPQPTPQEAARVKAEAVWHQVTESGYGTDGKWRAYNRDVVRADPIAKQLYQEMGAGYDFGKWPVEDVSWRKRQFVQGYVALMLAWQRRQQIDQGLSHGDSRAFLRDSGLGPILGDWNTRNGHDRH